MPLTPNGKVDRKTLMERTKIRTSERTLESGDPTTDRQILSILREVLQDFDSNIDFDSPIAGLDSLRSVELSCRIARQYGIELGISQLASCKTPAEIARLIARLSDQEDKGAFERALPESKGMAHAECTTDLRGPPPASSFLENPPRLIPKNERLLKAVLNRLLQLVARVAPDVWRVRLHKWRGVKIGRNVSIGYDSIIETSYPFLISIGDNVNIGMRATIIGHFRGMVDSSAGKPTVVIEDFAFIGPGVIVLPNTQIGRGAVIAAGSVVTRNIPAMTFAQGNPVRVVARCGIPLSGRATFKEFLEQLKPLP
jgi:acetyltransferase-like isoleucine patch superfamily enzyme/acyl carrier protein